jgi:NodT family efflux transporter outer membrane factor (OMF) lipoprotein
LRAFVARGGRSLGTLALLATATTACMVGPHYYRPSVSVNDHWTAANDPRLASRTPVDSLWWHSFNDSTLDRLIDTAYRQNIALQIAGTRIMEARAELGIADAQWWPVNRNPIASPTAGAIVPFNGNQPILYGAHAVGFDAAWEPDFWGRVRHGTRAAAAAYGATVADYQGALVALSAEVARTYVAIRTYQVLIARARDNVAIQEEGLQVAHARVHHGATSGLDESQATSLLETTRATVPELQIGLQQAQNALCTLLGQTSGCEASAVSGPEEIPVVPARVAIGVPAELLRRRPDIRSAELFAMAQCDRIGIAMSELYPSFDLTGALGVRTVVTTGSQSSLAGLLGIFNPGAFIVSLGAGMFWPILGYPRILNNIRVQDARFQQSLLNYQNVVLRAEQEVEDGIAGFLREQESAEFAQNAVVAAQDSVHLALVQYREGATDYQRVLDTQRTLLQSQITAARMRGAIATNAVALYKALGGGWELRDGQPVISDRTRTEMERRTNWGGALSTPRPANSSPQQAPSNIRR